jgi:hypothetical protein
MRRPASTRPERPVLLRAANGATLLAHGLVYAGIAALALTAAPLGILLLATSAVIGGSAVLMAGDAQAERELDEPTSVHGGDDHGTSVSRPASRCEVRP